MFSFLYTVLSINLWLINGSFFADEAKGKLELKLQL